MKKEHLLVPKSRLNQPNKAPGTSSTAATAMQLYNASKMDNGLSDPAEGKKAMAVGRDEDHPEIFVPGGGHNNTTYLGAASSNQNNTTANENSSYLLNNQSLDQNNMTIGDISRGAILDKYRQQNKDILFYMRPDTADIFLMDFRQNRFVKEEVPGFRVPFKASTMLTSDGNIYVIGGYRLEQAEP